MNKNEREAVLRQMILDYLAQEKVTRAEMCLRMGGYWQDAISRFMSGERGESLSLYRAAYKVLGEQVVPLTMAHD